MASKLPTLPEGALWANEGTPTPRKIERFTRKVAAKKIGRAIKAKKLKSIRRKIKERTLAQHKAAEASLEKELGRYNKNGDYGGPYKYKWELLASPKYIEDQIDAMGERAWKEETEATLKELDDKPPDRTLFGEYEWRGGKTLKKVGAAAENNSPLREGKLRYANDPLITEIYRAKKAGNAPQWMQVMNLEGRYGGPYYAENIGRALAGKSEPSKKLRNAIRNAHPTLNIRNPAGELNTQKLAALRKTRRKAREAGGKADV